MKILPLLSCHQFYDARTFHHLGSCYCVGAHGYTTSSNSSWNFNESSVFPILAMFFVLSAYFDVTDITRSLPKSHTMIMKRMGPNTVPCGIPDITLNDSDNKPFADICWDLPTKNSLIHIPNLPEIPSAFNL